MDLVMCTSCGGFVIAVRDGDAVRPSYEACPECGGTEFTDADLEHGDGQA